MTIASIMAIVGACLTPAMLNATDPVTPPTNSSETDLKKGYPIDPTRPRVPSNQTIHIVYTPITQECFFGLPDGIDHVSVEIVGDEIGFTFYDEVYSSDPIAIVPMTYGSYSITCTTDDGSSFSGYITIE